MPSTKPSLQQVQWRYPLPVQTNSVTGGAEQDPMSSDSQISGLCNLSHIVQRQVHFCLMICSAKASSSQNGHPTNQKKWISDLSWDVEVNIIHALSGSSDKWMCFYNHLSMITYSFIHLAIVYLASTIKWIRNIIIIFLKLINSLQNSKDIVILVGNRNYLVSNLTMLDLNHMITDYRTNYKAEGYIMNCFFSIIS